MLNLDQRQPTSCRIPLRHFVFTFTVEPLQGNEYRIAGQARPRPLTIKPHSGILEGRFSFLLIRHGAIREVVSIVPRGDLGFPLSFQKRFRMKAECDAVAVTYKIEHTGVRMHYIKPRRRFRG